ncbi:MAG TPA: UBP-type zinc finger domain-containing protein [Streptosporangiaceae bacterium]
MTAGVIARGEPADLTDGELQERVNSGDARCVRTAVPPDEWFPLTGDPVKARRHAWRALQLCAACPVRAECLELSLRQWKDTGHYGIWGGTLENERVALRRAWLAGATVRTLLGSVRGNQPATSRGHRTAGCAEPPAGHKPLRGLVARDSSAAPGVEPAYDRHLTLIRPVVPLTEGCEECLHLGSAWVHLRLCLSCGHVGCCDSSPLRHARRHASTSGHLIAGSLGPGENWRWCYTDRTYV